jgi:hypothetical protein
MYGNKCRRAENVKQYEVPHADTNCFRTKILWRSWLLDSRNLYAWENEQEMGDPEILGAEGTCMIGSGVLSLRPKTSFDCSYTWPVIQLATVLQL